MGCITSGTTTDTRSILDIARDRIAEEEAALRERTANETADRVQAEARALAEYRALREHDVSGDFERSLGFKLDVAMLFPRTREAVLRLPLKFGDGEFFRVNDLLLFWKKPTSEIPPDEPITKDTFRGSWSVIGYEEGESFLFPIVEEGSLRFTMDKIVMMVQAFPYATFECDSLSDRLHLG